METRANPLIVGLFVLGIVASALGFVAWMGSYGAAGSKVAYDVVFQGEVTGLTEGSSVLYNGIRVGDVGRLRLATDDPSKVVATVRLDPGYPITAATNAQLQFQGITGVAYVQLQPSEGDAGEPLPPGSTIVAQRSNFQDLLEGGQSLLTKIDSVVEKIDDVLAQNEQSVGQTVRNVEAFTQALADNSGNVAGFLTDAASAARRLNTLGEKVGRLADNVDLLVAAIDPEDVRQAVAGARSFTDALSGSAGQIDEIAANVTSASQRIDTLAGTLEGAGQRIVAVVEAVDPERVTNTLVNLDTFTGQLAAAGEQIDGLLTDVRGAARRVDEVGEGVNTLVAAIEPARLGNTVANAESFTAALARNGAELDGLMGDARTAVQDLGGLTGRLAQVAEAIEPERVSRTLANVDSFTGQLSAAGEQIDGLLTDMRGAARRVDEVGTGVNTLVAAIEPARLGNTVANAESFTAALARNGAELDGLMADARTAAQEVGAAGSSVTALSDDLRGVVGAVDAESVETVVANVRRFSDVLAANADKITTLTDSAVSAADRIDRASARLDGIGADVGAVVAAVDPEKVARTLDGIESFSTALGRNSEAVDGFVTDARAAAASLSEAGTRAAEATESARQVLAAVEPDQIRAVMNNVRGFTDMLAGNRESIEALVRNAGTAATQIGGFAERASELAAAVDPTAVQRSITNVESFTLALATKTEQVESFIDDASAVAAQLRTTSAKLDALLTNANGMLEGGGDGLITEATAAARAIRIAAENLSTQVGAISGDIQRYGTGGLRDFQQLMADGRQTLAEVERVIRRLEQNPAGFFTGGGSQVQEYNPGRRF